MEFDTQGNKLSEEQTEFFKDTKVQRDGKLLVCRHVTASGDFDIFDISKSKNSDDFGIGFYFSSNDALYKEEPGLRTLYCYLNLPRLMTEDSHLVSDKQWEEFAKEVLPEGFPFSIKSTTPDALNYKGICDFYFGDKKKFLDAAIDILEVDGVYWKGKESDCIVAFKSESIKTIDNKKPNGSSKNMHESSSAKWEIDPEKEIIKELENDEAFEYLSSELAKYSDGYRKRSAGAYYRRLCPPTYAVNYDKGYLVKYIDYCLAVRLICALIDESARGKTWEQKLPKDGLCRITLTGRSGPKAILRFSCESLADDSLPLVHFGLNIDGFAAQDPVLREAYAKGLDIFDYPTSIALELPRLVPSLELPECRCRVKELTLSTIQWVLAKAEHMFG